VAERRRQILEATCSVVAERGFRAVRIVDVAERAGYSTGTVHYYFDSKDDLLKEAFRFQYEQSVGRRETYFTEDDDPVTRLRKMADGYLPTTPKTIEAWRVWMELWVSALGDRAMSEINDYFYSDWRQAVLDAVHAGVEQGLLATGDPVAFADAYVAMMDGLAIQVLIGSRHMDAEQMRVTCRAFVDGAVVAPGR
jgi:AcrR family transcriptional regulator